MLCPISQTIISISARKSAAISYLIKWNLYLFSHQISNVKLQTVYPINLIKITICKLFLSSYVPPNTGGDRRQK